MNKIDSKKLNQSAERKHQVMFNPKRDLLNSTYLEIHESKSKAMKATVNKTAQKLFRFFLNSIAK